MPFASITAYVGVFSVSFPLMNSYIFQNINVSLVSTSSTTGPLPEPVEGSTRYLVNFILLQRLVKFPVRDGFGQDLLVAVEEKHSGSCKNIVFIGGNAVKAFQL